MTSIVIKKNMFMKHRYGFFKSIVYRRMQLKSFTACIILLLNNQSKAIRSPAKVLMAIEIYDYLSKTKDIWWSLSVSSVIKKKLLEIAGNDIILQQYLVGFGYICTYTKLDGNMCCKRLQDENSLCKQHTACKDRLKNRVSENLPSIHTEIHSIVFKYLF